MDNFLPTCVINILFAPLFVHSSRVEMGKWIEDLNLAIDMSKKSHEKSSIFLDVGLSDRSNRKINLIM